MMLYH